jgi:hypothetical protein
MFVLTERSVNISIAINLAAHGSCQHLLEQFAKDFILMHSSFNSTLPPRCHQVLTFTNSCFCFSSIFQHLECCAGITSDENPLLLVGNELKMALKNVNDTPPTEGSMLKLYQSLSKAIFHRQWLRTNIGEVVIPYDLSLPIKRFLIKFLHANDMKIVVTDVNGTVRDPFPEEVDIPSKP